MNHIYDMHEYLIAKIVGSSAGSLIAIALILPKTFLEAVRRWAAGTGIGIVGAIPLCYRLGWPIIPENVVLSAAILGFCGWWAGGLLARVMDNFSKSPVVERAIDNMFMQWLKQKKNGRF